MCRPRAFMATQDVFARISASRGAHPVCAFAGGALPEGGTTLLHICARVLLPLLDSAAVLPLRASCREAAAATAAHEWQDCATLVRGRVAAWRACFPRALAANLATLDGRREPLRVAPRAAARGAALRRRLCAPDGAARAGHSRAQGGN